MVASILDDLRLGDGGIRPDAESGYKAGDTATPGPVAEGCVGAGAGATVGTGSYFGGLRMKSGIGTASIRVRDFVIGAIGAVNATGDRVEWPGGRVLAGARRADGKGFVGIAENGRQQMAEQVATKTAVNIRLSMVHTITGVIATNLDFDKSDLTKGAGLANTGAAKVINPHHTTEDGDVLYAVSTRKRKLPGDQEHRDIALAGIIGAEVAATAIMRAAKMATSIEGIPVYRDDTAKLNPKGADCAINPRSILVNHNRCIIKPGFDSRLEVHKASNKALTRQTATPPAGTQGPALTGRLHGSPARIQLCEELYEKR